MSSGLERAPRAAEGAALADRAMERSAGSHHPIRLAREPDHLLTRLRAHDAIPGRVLGKEWSFLRGPGACATPRRNSSWRPRGRSYLWSFSVPQDGAAFWNALTVAPIRDAGAGSQPFVVSLRRFRQKRLEANSQPENGTVGRLAGGVAHDFNNIVTSSSATATSLEAPDWRTNTQLIEEIEGR